MEGGDFYESLLVGSIIWNEWEGNEGKQNRFSINFGSSSIFEGFGGKRR
jgi:hypothetical protein